MTTRQIILAGIIIIALLSATETVMASGGGSAATGNPDAASGTNGADFHTIGPENPLFGLKVALENLDETFTVNDTRRVEKQVDHAQARIDEVQQELGRNETGNADRSLELYREKLNQTEAVLLRFPVNATGLLHAQEVIAGHQAVLADLLVRYPDNPGLSRAYNNSQVLEQKFGEKTRMKFDRITGKNNITSFKAVKLDTGKQNTNSDTATGGSSGQGRNDTQDRVKDKKTDVPGTPTVTQVHPIPADTRGSSGKKGK